MTDKPARQEADGGSLEQMIGLTLHFGSRTTEVTCAQLRQIAVKK